MHGENQKLTYKTNCGM